MVKRSPALLKLEAITYGIAQGMSDDKILAYGKSQGLDIKEGSIRWQRRRIEKKGTQPTTTGKPARPPGATPALKALVDKSISTETAGTIQELQVVIGKVMAIVGKEGTEKLMAEIIEELSQFMERFGKEASEKLAAMIIEKISQ